MSLLLKEATNAAYRRGLADGRAAELVHAVRLVGRLARDAYGDSVRFRELNRVQEVLFIRQKELDAGIRAE